MAYYRINRSRRRSGSATIRTLATSTVQGFFHFGFYNGVAVAFRNKPCLIRNASLQPSPPLTLTGDLVPRGARHAASSSHFITESSDSLYAVKQKALTVDVAKPTCTHQNLRLIVVHAGVVHVVAILISRGHLRWLRLRLNVLSQ